MALLRCMYSQYSSIPLPNSFSATAALQWMRSCHDHSCPQCVSIQGAQYSHILFHTSLLLTRVMMFASSSSILSVYMPWFNLGTHCSFLLGTGYLKAVVKRSADVGQVSLTYQTVVLWHVSATSTFAEIVSLQNISWFKQPPPMTKAPPVCITLKAAKRVCQHSSPEYPVL